MTQESYNRIDEIVTSNDISIDKLQEYIEGKTEKELVNIIKEHGVRLPQANQASIYIDARLRPVDTNSEKFIVTVVSNNQPPRQDAVRRLWLFMNEYIRLDICFMEDNEHRVVNEIALHDIDKSYLYELYKYIKEHITTV